jgi:hypothetical protein
MRHMCSSNTFAVILDSLAEGVQTVRGSYSVQFPGHNPHSLPARRGKTVHYDRIVSVCPLSGQYFVAKVWLWCVFISEQGPKAPPPPRLESTMYQSHTLRFESPTLACKCIYW